MTRSSWLLAAAIVAAVLPAIAAADTVPERARALAEEGRAAHDAQDYDRAIRAFTEANALAPAPALLFNLAQAYRLKGNCDDAALMYRRFLATNPDPDSRAIAEEHLATTERCSRKVALSIPLDVKEHASAPGANTTAKPSTAITSAVDSEPPGHKRRQLGVGMMIGGGLALAVATYFTLDAHDAQNDVEAGYAAGSPGWDIAPIDERGKRSEKLAIGLGIGGGALVAGGVITYVLGRRAERAQVFAVVPTQRGGEVHYAWRF